MGNSDGAKWKRWEARVQPGRREESSGFGFEWLGRCGCRQRTFPSCRQAWCQALLSLRLPGLSTWRCWICGSEGQPDLEPQEFKTGVRTKYCGGKVSRRLGRRWERGKGTMEEEEMARSR